MPSTLLWLRRDLRLHDLPPLLDAAAHGSEVLACFVLGLLMSLEASCGEGSRRLMVLLGSGFLGSFSTFSSFIAELHAVLRQRKGLEALWLLGSSIGGGLLAMAIGLGLGGLP